VRECITHFVHILLWSFYNQAYTIEHILGLHFDLTLVSSGRTPPNKHKALSSNSWTIKKQKQQKTLDFTKVHRADQQGERKIQFGKQT
jgi:hypothetical protein